MYGLEGGLWYTEILVMSEGRLNGLVHLFHLKLRLTGRLINLLSRGIIRGNMRMSEQLMYIFNYREHYCACHIFVQNHQSTMHIFHLVLWFYQLTSLYFKMNQLAVKGSIEYEEVAVMLAVPKQPLKKKFKYTPRSKMQVTHIVEID